MDEIGYQCIIIITFTVCQIPKYLRIYNTKSAHSETFQKLFPNTLYKPCDLIIPAEQREQIT